MVEDREWVEKVVSACERVLASEPPDPGDPYYAELRHDVEKLHGRLTAELRADE